MDSITLKYKSKDKLFNLCFENIVTKCRKGLFLYVSCDTKSCYAEVTKILRKQLSAYRGVFTHKGIVAVVRDRKCSFKKYFDIQIIMEKENGRK